MWERGQGRLDFALNAQLTAQLGLVDHLSPVFVTLTSYLQHCVASRTAQRAKLRTMNLVYVEAAAPAQDVAKHSLIWRTLGLPPATSGRY